MTARVLVVEDEEALTLLLRYNLEAEGYAVEFDELQFGDLIFLDTAAAEAELHARRHNLEVTHVVFALDAPDFLHASRRHGGVARGSFDPHSPWYVPTYRERFVGARRYL